MTEPSYFILSRRYLAITLAAIFGFVAIGIAADEPTDLVQTGKIVKVNAKQLVVLEIKKKHRFTLGDEVMVTLDGKPIGAIQLKPGMLAKVGYLIDGENKVAVRIDANTVRP